MRTALTIVAAVLLAGMGFFAGHRFGLAEATRRTGEVRRDIAELRAAVVENSREVMLMSVAAAQSGQGRNPPGGAATATAQAAAPPAVVPPTEKPEPAKVTEADRKLLHEAQALIDQAMTRGAWTAVDEERFRQIRAEPSSVDWLPVMTRLSAALSDGRMKPPPIGATAY